MVRWLLKMADKYHSVEDELKKLIAFKPVTKDKEATKRLLEYVQSELEQIGLLTKLTAHGGFSSLVAGTKSLQRSKVLLQAHIDVVPPLNQRHFEPRIRAGNLFARGAYDMLFATATFLATLRNLHHNQFLLDLDIGVMLTSDEEVGGHDGVEVVVQEYEFDTCFLPDAGTDKEINVGAKGVLELEVILQGFSGHTAVPSAYDNPILKLAKFIAAVEERFSNTDPQATTCSITMVKAGEALNQVPDTAHAFLDIRYVPEDDAQEIVATIEALAKQQKGTVKQLVLERPYSTNIENGAANDFLQIYKRLTGQKLQFGRALGSSDARFMDQRGRPIIMVRPKGGGLHAPDEHVSLASLEQYVRVLEVYLEEKGGI